MIRVPISQTTLAGMVGTTRPRMNHLLNKFKTRGFIEIHGGFTINPSLLNVVLHDDAGGAQTRWRTKRTSSATIS